MNILSFKYRTIINLWVLAFVLGLFPQTVLSQEVAHTFKITGQKQIDSFSGNISVEYDSLSADHLYLFNHTYSGFRIDKTCYLFKGKKFNLLNADDYSANKELLKDGVKSIYNDNEQLGSESIYKEGVLQQQTVFYSNGNKQMTVMGDEKALNGAFKMWYPNGQLSFSGNYKNNLKEGLFQSFDESGKLEREGTYREGKLIEGVAVVQDFVYNTPEVPAQYQGNDSILNKILIKKSGNLIDVITMDSTIQMILDLKFTIDKTGMIKKVDITNSSTPLNVEVVQAVFNKQFMNFQPALMEGVPVSSYFNKSFLLSHLGLQTYKAVNTQENIISADSIYSIVEEMPEFPGGEMGLRNFIALNVRYPVEAAESGIHGKVLVGFVVRENGSISNISILKSVHPLLDAEAIRIIKIIKSMPRWKPGKQNGKTVNVKYTVPINFELR